MNTQIYYLIVEVRITTLIIWLAFCLLLSCNDAPGNYEFENTKVLRNLGTFKIKSLSERTLVFDKSEGDLTDKDIFDRGDTLGFNIDHLYRCRFPGYRNKYYYFRMYWQDPFLEETKLFINWVDGNPLAIFTKGLEAEIEIVEIPFIQNGQIGVCTIGDSQTWLLHGEKYRYYWSQLNPNLKFVGSRTDYYGFGHEGEGGNSSAQVIERLSFFPKADIYVLLIGTNDRKANITTHQTLENIDSIAKFLKQKSIESKVYILTIPPCEEPDRDIENREINSLLKKYFQRNQRNIFVLDVENLFRTKKNWQEFFSDGLHPNDAGYRLLTDLLNEKIH